MRQIDLYDGALHIALAGDVKQYPSRTASVRDRFMELRRDEGRIEGLINDLADQLAEAAGRPHNNHTVYEVVTPSGNRLYVMFHDLSVYIGFAVEEGFW